MPYEWHLDHANCLIHVRGHGQGTTADTLQLIAELRDSLLACPNYDLIYESVDLHIQSTPADMMKLANALFRDAGARFRRFALVVPPARVGLARMFAALAHPFGVTANIFDDVESAREWLALHPERKEKPAEPAPGSAGAEPPRPVEQESPEALEQKSPDALEQESPDALEQEPPSPSAEA